MNNQRSRTRSINETFSWEVNQRCWRWRTNILQPPTEETTKRSKSRTCEYVYYKANENKNVFLYRKFFIPEKTYSNKISEKIMAQIRKESRVSEAEHRRVYVFAVVGVIVLQTLCLFLLILGNDTTKIDFCNTFQWIYFVLNLSPRQFVD